MFTVLYGDPPSGEQGGAVLYRLHDDAGRTFRLFAAAAQLEPLGGAHALHGRRVRIQADTAGLPAGTARVRSIARY